jgi:hypothetical protein
MPPTQTRLDTKRIKDDNYIRAKLFAGDKSNLRRYADLVIGEGGSYWQLLKYELITFFFGGYAVHWGFCCARSSTHCCLRRSAGELCSGET